MQRTLCFHEKQEVLDYLGLFADTSGTNVAAAHPCQMVVDAFQEDDAAFHMLHKLHAFLEETMRVHGNTFEKGELSVTRLGFDKTGLLRPTSWRASAQSQGCHSTALCLCPTSS